MLVRGCERKNNSFEGEKFAQAKRFEQFGYVWDGRDAEVVEGLSLAEKREEVDLEGADYTGGRCANDILTSKISRTF